MDLQLVSSIFFILSFSWGYVGYKLKHLSGIDAIQVGMVPVLPITMYLLISLIV